MSTNIHFESNEAPVTSVYRVYLLQSEYQVLQSSRAVAHQLRSSARTTATAGAPAVRATAPAITPSTAKLAARW